MLAREAQDHGTTARIVAMVDITSRLHARAKAKCAVLADKLASPYHPCTRCRNKDLLSVPPSLLDEILEKNAEANQEQLGPHKFEDAIDESNDESEWTATKEKATLLKQAEEENKETSW